MIVGEKYLGDTRVLLHGTGERFFKSRLKDDNFVEPGTFLSPTFDSAGMQNVIDSLSNAQHQWKEFPLIMVVDGDLPVCWEEGSSEESVIAHKIPRRNILWTGSLSTIEGVDFRKGWGNLFDPDPRNESTESVTAKVIDYFRNLGFEEVAIK